MDLSEDEDNPAELLQEPQNATSVKRKAPNEGSRKRTKESSQTTGKTFQKSWLLDPQFKSWLEPVEDDDTKARCSCCRSLLNCGKSELQKHAATEKHVKAVKKMKGCLDIRRVFDTASATAAEKAKEAHCNKVKGLELRLAAYFAEHNVAYYNSDHLVEVLKKGVTDSAIVKDVTLGHKKCSAVISKVLAKTETEELSEELRTTLFSVLIDESTDVSNRKNMCILVRYVSSTTKLPKTTLLELVQVDAHDCSAARLFEEFKNCLERKSIPLKNVIGLGCDNASVMTGKFNSFWQQLKDVCPYAVLIRCVCHSSALVTKHAMAVLPSYVEGFLRSISTYVSNSPKRCAELQDFQELYEEESLKVLKPAATRWLVLHACIKRFFEIEQSLLGFFRTTTRENPHDKEAANIFNMMQNPYLKAYLLFLEYTMNSFNEFNALFQSQKVMIHRISDDSKKLLTKLCQNFVNPEELRRVHIVKFSHPSNLLPPDRIYLGPACSKYLKDMVTEAKTDPEKKKKPELLNDLLRNVEKFQLKCRDFYAKAAEEMQSRLPLNDDLFREMAFLDPGKLLSPEIRSADKNVGGIADLCNLASNFKDILELDENALAIDWRTIPYDIDGGTRERLLQMSVDEAWANIFDMKNFREEPMFPQLSKLAKSVLSLPHSNAEAERSFSIVTDVKTKKRNRIGAVNLNAIAVIRSSFARKKVSCNSFEITKAHLDKYTQDIYKTQED